MKNALFLGGAVFAGILVLAGVVGGAARLSAAIGAGSSAPGQLSPPGTGSSPGHLSAPGQLSPPRGLSGPGGGIGANLVDNPSFEQGLKGWDSVQVVGNNLSGIDDTVDHRGKRSYRHASNITCDPLTGDWWYIQTTNAIPVNADRTYSVSTWYLKSEGGGIGIAYYYGGAALAQSAREAPSVEVRQSAGGSPDVAARNGASANGVSPHQGRPGDGDWAEIGFDFPVPPGVTAVRVFIGNGTVCDAPWTSHADDVALVIVN